MIAQQSELSAGKFDKILAICRRSCMPGADAGIRARTKQLRLLHQNRAPGVVCLDRHG
jgi:hypothetical protein